MRNNKIKELHEFLKQTFRNCVFGNYKIDDGIEVLEIVIVGSVYSNFRNDKIRNKPSRIILLSFVGLFFATYFILNDIQNNTEIDTKCNHKSCYTFYTITYTIFGLAANNSSYYYYRFR